MTENRWIPAIENKAFVASYSGGKDSSLALYKAMQYGKAIGLIVMLEEQGEKSRSHGMPSEIIQAQADAIGLPIFAAASNWADYEQNFINLLENASDAGAETLVTGDLDVVGHADWNEQVTQKAGLSLCMPLWDVGRKEAVDELIQLGFKTMVVTVNTSLGMNEDDLGRIMTTEYVNELIQRGIDPCGESGEFHTTVLDGPLFKLPIEVQQHPILRHNEYAFLPLTLK